MQRESATFDRLSDLINYQREARFLAYVRWAEEHDYDLAKSMEESDYSDYSGEKLAPDSSLHAMFSNFTKLRLVHLIKQRHKENQGARGHAPHAHLGPRHVPVEPGRRANVCGRVC